VFKYRVIKCHLYSGSAHRKLLNHAVTLRMRRKDCVGIYM